MILTDCHVHSAFSSDSEANVEDIIQQALHKGMKYVYLTDHHDIDFLTYQPGGPDFQLDTDVYLHTLKTLKEQYSSQIDIRIGVELGLMPAIKEQLEAYTSNYDFDFIIGSSHLVRGLDPYYPEYYQGRTEIQAYRDYFISIHENIQSFHDFDVYGHLDYALRYGPTKNKNWDFAHYQDIFIPLLKDLIHLGKGIEINTAGLYKGLGYPHPHKDILSLYRDLGGEIITIGSDAHSPEHLGYGFEEAADLLKQLGFRYYTLFHHRKPEFYPL